MKKTFPDLELEAHKLAEHPNGEHSEQFKAEAVKMVAQAGIVKTASKFMLHESTLTSGMTDDDGSYCSESFKFDSYLKNHMKLHESCENFQGKQIQ